MSTITNNSYCFNDKSKQEKSNMGSNLRLHERSRVILNHFILILMVLLITSCQLDHISVEISNPLDFDRLGEIVPINRATLRGDIDLEADISVFDTQNNQEVVSQTLDLDQDGEWDELLLQVDLKAHEQRIYRLVNLAATEVKSKVYGRFVPERKDDFAWENDRIAFRMYGPALERTGEISSGVDVWSKSVTYPIIDQWYVNADYHKDHGEGADYYKVGPTRGCGGLGIFRNDTLYTANNFTEWRIIATGPLRFVFELDYAAWGPDAPGLCETKRISLDVGEYLNHFESRFTDLNVNRDSVQFVTGLTTHPEQTPEPITLNSSDDYMLMYEAYENDQGRQGTAVVRKPSSMKKSIKKWGDQYLFLLPRAEQYGVSYYAGASWSKSYHMPDEESWYHYVKDFQERVRHPLDVTVIPN